MPCFSTWWILPHLRCLCQWYESNADQRLCLKHLELRVSFDWIWSATVKAQLINCCIIQCCLFLIVDCFDHIWTDVPILMISFQKCDDEISRLLFHCHIVHFSLIQHHRWYSKIYVMNKLTTLRSCPVDAESLMKVQNQFSLQFNLIWRSDDHSVLVCPLMQKIQQVQFSILCVKNEQQSQLKTNNVEIRNVNISNTWSSLFQTVVFEIVNENTFNIKTLSVNNHDYMQVSLVSNSREWC